MGSDVVDDDDDVMLEEIRETLQAVCAFGVVERERCEREKVIAAVRLMANEEDEMEYRAEGLYRGDCLDWLRSLPDGCVDFIFTDPPSVGGAKACWCDTLGDTETQGGNLVMPTAAAQIVSANYTQYDAGYGARGMRLVSGVGSELSFHTGWIGDGDNGLIVEVICRHGFHETFYLTDAATDVERLDLLINVLKTAQAVLSLRAANSEMEEAE